MDQTLSLWGDTENLPAVVAKSDEVVGPIAPTSEGGLVTSWDLGWWQQHRQPLSYSEINSTVEACVSALSQTTAMCPIHHMLDEDEKGITRKKGSGLERVMLNPNPYQTRSEFMVDMIRALYLEGNAYAVARRDGNRAISELHPMNPRGTRAVVNPENGDVYYFASPTVDQPVAFYSEEDRIFPARDVLHLKLYTTNNKLRGETPIAAAVNSINANNKITGHQNHFFGNMSRPSGALATEQKLTLDEMKQLRTAWEEQSARMNSGGLPILSQGLKFESMALTSQDAELVAAYGMTVADISRAFRVPLVLINDMSGATFNNAEQTINYFLMSGLGFLLDHIELSIGRLFDIPFKQSVQFNTNALLRVDFATRVKGLKEAVTGGIYSPDDARLELGKGTVEGGDEPRVQQQMQPLSAFEQTMQLEQDKLEVAANQPDPEPDPADEDADDPPEEDADDIEEPDEEKLYELFHSEYTRALASNE